jgi:hypothetical protein
MSPVATAVTATHRCAAVAVVIMFIAPSLVASSSYLRRYATMRL